MREIKFRAWIPEAEMLRSDCEGGMFYQENQYLQSFLRRICDQYVVEHPSYLNFQVEERLTQYIGLKSEKGNPIYEGDVIKIYGANLEDTEKTLVGEIKFEQGRAILVNKSFPDSYYNLNDLTYYKSIDDLAISDIHILGNKFENPELLELK